MGARACYIDARDDREGVDDSDNNELQTLTIQPTGPELETVAAEPEPRPLGAWFGSLSVRERIVLRDLHSSGGIGEVWRAFDEVLGREVALKRLRGDKADSDANRARFFREARLTGQLDHPGIVPVYDFVSSEDGRECFYTMRFLQGRTLSEVITEFHETRRREGGPVIRPAFLDLLAAFVSIANTVAFAHARGIVHRDLKSDNVILGDYGEVIVLDWGLAKRIGEAVEDQAPEAARSDVPGTATEAAEREPGESDSRASTSASRRVDPYLTLQGELLGTPAYMAPEQALGHIDQIDERTDVYGLAAILYEILTGQPPFRGRELSAVIDAVVGTPPVPPSERVPGIPAALERLCLHGLAKRVDDRPESAASLAAEVRRWLHELTERRRSQQERERFFELSLDLLAIVDSEGRLRQTNGSWTRLLGWSPEQRAERALVELVDACSAAELEAALASVGPEHEHAEVELCMRAAPSAAELPRARSRWVHWNLRWLPGEDAVYLVGRDVTGRRAREREVEGLLESAPDAMCVVDEDGRIVRVNAELERMFGYPRAALIGEPIELFVPAEQRDRHRGHVSRYVREPALRPMGVGLRLRGQRADGSVFGVEISLSPVETPERTLIACTLRDTDARERAVRDQAAQDRADGGEQG